MLPCPVFQGSYTGILQIFCRNVCKYPESRGCAYAWVFVCVCCVQCDLFLLIPWSLTLQRFVSVEDQILGSEFFGSVGSSHVSAEWRTLSLSTVNWSQTRCNINGREKVKRGNEVSVFVVQWWFNKLGNEAWNQIQWVSRLLNNFLTSQFSHVNVKTMQNSSV